MNNNGDLFGERWVINSEAFVPPVIDTSPDFSAQLEVADKSVAQLGVMLKGQKPTGWSKPSNAHKYNKFGNGELSDIVSITMHTRFATCDKSLKNVHPFVDEAFDTSVIHNGVISNHREFNLTRSTCDSESILISYIEENVAHDLNNMQIAVDRMRGYYACGVYSRDASGARILDVFKLNNNNLCVAYIFQLDTFVLTTQESDLNAVCNLLGYTHNGIQSLNDGVITRFNPFPGEVIEQASFNPPPVTQYQGSYGHSYNGATVYKPSFKGNSVSPARAKFLALPSRLVEKNEREVQELSTYWGE